MKFKDCLNDEKYAIMKELMATKVFDGKSLYLLGLEVMEHLPGAYYSPRISYARKAEEEAKVPDCIFEYRLKFFKKYALFLSQCVLDKCRCFGRQHLPGPLAMLQDIVDQEILHVLTNIYFASSSCKAYFEAESIISWIKLWYPHLASTLDVILNFMGSRYRTVSWCVYEYFCRYLHYRTGSEEGCIESISTIAIAE